MLENMKMPFNKKITLAITLGVFTPLSPFVQDCQWKKHLKKNLHMNS